MQRDPVDEPAPARQTAILGDSQAVGVDVHPADAAVEIVPVCMVSGVLPAPHEVGGERNQAAEDAHCVIRPSRAQKRAVPAIVLNDEDAHD
jgi:hypothetical protein